MQTFRRCLVLLTLVVAAGIAAGCAIGGDIGPILPKPAGQDASRGHTGTTIETSTLTGIAAPEGGNGPAARDQVTVALILPLSAQGSTPVIAKTMKQAAELAVVESGSATVKLVVKDDRGTPEGASAAVDEAIKEGAEAILGPLFSTAVKAAAPVARAAKIPIIAFSNDRQAAGAGVYLIGFQPEADVERIIGYAVSQGKRRIAAFISDDAFGRLVEAALTRAAAKMQATIVLTERYQPQANQMLEPMRRVAEEIRRSEADGQPVDALFIPGGPENIAAVSPMLAYAEVDTQKVKLLGTGGWDSPQLGREALFVGGWYPAPDPKGWREFAERYAATFGTAPPRIASLAFDAAKLATEQAGVSKATRFTAEALARASFSGVDGPLRLGVSGTVERGLAILEVQTFGAAVIEPAAQPVGESGLN